MKVLLIVFAVERFRAYVYDHEIHVLAIIRMTAWTEIQYQDWFDGHWSYSSALVKSAIAKVRQTGTIPERHEVESVFTEVAITNSSRTTYEIKKRLRNKTNFNMYWQNSDVENQWPAYFRKAG